jgi:hypothetical protein
MIGGDLDALTYLEHGRKKTLRKLQMINPKVYYEV